MIAEALAFAAIIAPGAAWHEPAGTKALHVYQGHRMLHKHYEQSPDCSGCSTWDYTTTGSRRIIAEYVNYGSTAAVYDFTPRPIVVRWSR